MLDLRSIKLFFILSEKLVRFRHFCLGLKIKFKFIDSWFFISQSLTFSISWLRTLLASLVFFLE